MNYLFSFTDTPLLQRLDETSLDDDTDTDEDEPTPSSVPRKTTRAQTVQRTTPEAARPADVLEEVLGELKEEKHSQYDI